MKPVIRVTPEPERVVSECGGLTKFVGDTLQATAVVPGKALAFSGRADGTGEPQVVIEFAGRYLSQWIDRFSKLAVGVEVQTGQAGCGHVIIHRDQTCAVVAVVNQLLIARQERCVEAASIVIGKELRRAAAFDRQQRMLSLNRTRRLVGVLRQFCHRPS